MHGAVGGWRRITRSVAALAIALLPCAQPVPLWATDPETLYRIECQGCHLADGTGGLDSIPTLRNHVAKFLDVAGGREYLVQVPGVALSPLTDQELADVLNWMLFTFGPAASMRDHALYSVDEVARLRKQPLTDVVKKRQELVPQIQQTEPGKTPPEAQFD